MINKVISQSVPDGSFGNSILNSSNQNRGNLKPISTENEGQGEIVIVSKPTKLTTYKRKNRRSISTKSHPTTLKKKQGKQRLLELLTWGVSFPCCVRILMLEAGYKSRSTVYKWIEEDPDFAEQVECIEMAVLGAFEALEFQLAKGGQLLREIVEHEHYEKIDKDKKTIKERERLSRRWKAPNATAVIKGLERRSARIRRIQKAKDKIKALMEID